MENGVYRLGKRRHENRGNESPLAGRREPADAELDDRRQMMRRAAFHAAMLGILRSRALLLIAVEIERAFGEYGDRHQAGKYFQVVQHGVPGM